MERLNNSQDPKCSCPSGNGSLCWPCPVHPASDIAAAPDSSATAGAAAIRELSDPEIVEVLASLGTDAEKSKYPDNPVLQVHTTVPGIREIVAAYITRARGAAASMYLTAPEAAAPERSDTTTANSR